MNYEKHLVYGDHTILKIELHTRVALRPSLAGLRLWLLAALARSPAKLNEHLKNSSLQGAIGGAGANKKLASFDSSSKA